MRENKPSMGQPLGKSKGYGFLSFKTHNMALQCLRKVNNNPNIFGKNNRPIVSFSIEDRAVHNLKMKRLEKSKQCNPLCKTKRGKTNKLAVDIKPKVKKFKPDSKPIQKNFKASKQNTAEPEVDNFAGVTSERGSQFKTRPMWKLREEASTHNKKLGEEKKEIKMKKQEDEIRREKRQIERPKQGKRKNEVDSVLVNKYIRLLHSQDNVGERKTKRSKWYTD